MRHYPDAQETLPYHKNCCPMFELFLGCLERGGVANEHPSQTAFLVSSFYDFGNSLHGSGVALYIRYESEEYVYFRNSAAYKTKGPLLD